MVEALVIMGEREEEERTEVCELPQIGEGCRAVPTEGDSGRLNAEEADIDNPLPRLPESQEFLCSRFSVLIRVSVSLLALSNMGKFLKEKLPKSSATVSDGRRVLFSLT